MMSIPIIPAMTLVFPDPSDGVTGTAVGETGAAGVTVVAGTAADSSTGVPQYSQNFLPGVSSFPQEVQNRIQTE